jgi:sulfur-oxidizing protein SoxZ
MAIKVKAKLRQDTVQVKLLIKHVMETGQRVDAETGKKIPAHHITEVVGNWDGKEVFRSNLGPAVSKNPYLSFRIKGPSVGDTISFVSVDNMGISDSGKTVVK